MRHNTNKNSFRLFAIATAFIVIALVSACGGKTDRADGADTVRLKRLPNRRLNCEARPEYGGYRAAGNEKCKGQHHILRILSQTCPYLLALHGAGKSGCLRAPHRGSASVRCRRRLAGRICLALTRFSPEHTTVSEPSAITSTVTVR